MKASNWEFKHRALVFGMVIWIGFLMNAIDHQNVTNAFADWVQHRYGTPSDGIARSAWFAAAAIVAIAALIRTWASSYLQAQVVYASKIKTAALVADGPYRHVRNPLYFANVLLIIGMGSMMSILGFVISAVLMVVFCYRLILREESELKTAQTGQYRAFCNAVPRLWPSLRPRVSESGRLPKWKNGFKAEAWFWGFALALAAFAVTLQLLWFFIVLGASLLLFWAMTKLWLLPPST